MPKPKVSAAMRERLFRSARQVMKNAYSPFSNFRVGAAIIVGFPPPPPPRDALDPPRSPPNPKVLPNRTFTLINPGPRPKLRGSSFSSGVGFGSRSPYCVSITPGLFGSVAMPGRALNMVVPKTSLPVVMLKGGPDCTVAKGLTRIFQRKLMDPPAVTLFRTSVEAGPYSPVKLYGFAGNVPRPSVLLMALFNM